MPRSPETQFESVSFEQGLLTSQPSSTVPLGYATALVNWEPMPTGGLRVRRKWSTATTSGAPATRRTRGIGTFVKTATFETPVLRTASHAVASGYDDNPSVSWVVNPLNGSQLFVVLSLSDDTASPTVTSTPAGWTLVKNEAHNTASEYVNTYLYTVDANTADRGEEQFTLSSLCTWYVSLWEYTGVFQQDGVIEGSGESTTTTLTTSNVNNTGTTSVANELWFVAMTTHGTTASAPTNGYTEQLDATHTHSHVSGTSSPGTLTNVTAGTIDWTNPTLAASSNNSYATVTLTTGQVSKYLHATNFGFAIPTTATITGIVVGVERFASANPNPTTGTGIYDSTIKLIGAAGSPVGNNKASASGWTTTEAVYSYGASNDLWGATWTPADINDADFGVGVSVTNTNPSSRTASVDHITITVYYTTDVSQMVYTKTVTATGDPDMQVTLSSAGVGTAVVAAFKAKANTVNVPLALIADDDGTNFDIYSINLDSIDSGAFTSVDANLTATARQYPVVFAAGLGHVVYTHRDFANTRKWDGTTVSSIAGAPEGRAIAFYANRFFIGGTTANPTRLHYSDLGDEDTWSAFIEISQDDGQPIEALCVTSEGLLIGKKSGLFLLTGRSPDTFQVHDLALHVEVAPGPSICSVPQGAVIAGAHQAWLWQGGAPIPISEPIEDQYEMTSYFMSVAYFDDEAYFCDEGGGTTWVYNLVNETWRSELVDTNLERPAIVWGDDSILLMGPKTATTNSSLSFRRHDATNRGRDDSLAETFSVSTPDFSVAPSRRHKPMRVHIRLRQRDGFSGEPGPTVTPYFDGAESDTELSIAAEDVGAFSEQVMVHRFDVGDNNLHDLARFVISHTATSADDATFDIEAIEYEYQIAEPS